LKGQRREAEQREERQLVKQMGMGMAVERRCEAAMAYPWSRVLSVFR